MLSAQYIVMIVAIIAAIIAILVFFVLDRPQTYTFAPSAQPLHVPENVISSDKMGKLIANDALTLSMYVFVSAVDRTPTLSAVSRTPLFHVDDALALEVGPGETRLAVRTQASAAEVKEEYIQLPILPQQKWVYLTVLKTGRRYDVMYNGEIVGSKTLSAVPIYRSSPLVVGHPSIVGSYVYGNAVNMRRSRDDVEAMRVKTSDTRGEPSVSVLQSVKNIFKVKVPSMCPPGVACAGAGADAQPGLSNAWETPYA
jgi:hypothetical protein